MTRYVPVLITLLLLLTDAAAQADEKWIIAVPGTRTLSHSGLPALVVTLMEGADSVQLGTVLTADGVAVVLPDTNLGEYTDVARVFPARSRTDGTFQSLDFSAEELRQLSLLPPLDRGDETAAETALFRPALRIPTLADYLSLIRIMEQRLERRIKVVVELEQCWRHRLEDKDLSSAVLEVAAQHGYGPPDAGFVLASYDALELQRLDNELLPETGLDVPLIQLIDTNDTTEVMAEELGRLQPYNFDWMLTKFGLKEVSTYADAIGPAPQTVFAADGTISRSRYLEDARLLGLQLLLYPLDDMLGSPPASDPEFEPRLEQVLYHAGFDGLLTSAAAEVRAYIAQRPEATGQDNERPISVEQLIEQVEAGKAGRFVPPLPAQPR